jgi:hypothetical protein
VLSPAGSAEAPPLLRADPADLRGLALSFARRDPSGTLPTPGRRGVDHVVIESGNAEATAFLLAAQLGLDLRMDISRADWHGRLLFFRCADLIVEVFAPTEARSRDSDKHSDSWYGLTWRVADLQSTHARLTAAGFDLSDIRRGRKPGTLVASARNRTAGVPTLLLQPAAST